MPKGTCYRLNKGIKMISNFKNDRIAKNRGHPVFLSQSIQITAKLDAFTP